MWHLTELTNYTQDLASTPEPEKGVLRHLWEHFFVSQKTAVHAEIEYESPPLQSAPTRLLDWVAPRPDWYATCRPPADDSSVELTENSVDDPPIFQSLPTAGEQVHRELDLALDDWCKSRLADLGIRVILAAPHSGVHEMVRGWAQHKEYLLCTPPASDQLWDDFDEWLAETMPQIQKGGEAGIERDVDGGTGQTRLVLIGLERYFVRHHNGLDFIRRLMDYLATSAPPSLIVCDSWAWAYLRDAIHLDAIVRPPLTLARHTGKALSEWLVELSSSSTYRSFTFRLEGDVLFTVGRERSNDENPLTFQRFSEDLADSSRGNPGIAQALWRNSMSIAAGVDMHEQFQLEAQDDPGYTIWIAPLDNLVLPIVPSTFTNDDAFILQTLLIHNGLSLDLLRQVLPLSSSHIMRRLQVMRNANLTRLLDDREEGRIEERVEVTPLGYFPVRTFLREHGFFVDDL